VFCEEPAKFLVLVVRKGLVNILARKEKLPAYGEVPTPEVFEY
jgi:hypothetical protein